MELGTMRRHHLSLVLEALLVDGPRSRATLAQDVGLTKATVSAVVSDLVEVGLVEEREARRTGGMGRPGIDVAARANHFGALGLEITVADVGACVVDLAGEVRVSQRRSSDNGRARPSTVVGRLRRVAEDAVERAAELGITCVGGALAVPGLVDPSTRKLVLAPNLHWHDVVLAPLIDELGLTLTVENEANLAALAELRHGAGKGLRSFVHLSAGEGIGGGLVLDEAVVAGSNGFAGELGHVVVDPAGPVCECGSTGCLEAVIRATDDPERVEEALAIALRSVVHLLDPQAVVLGGTLADLPDGVIDGVARRLRTDTIGGRWHPCEVRRSTLGADAALLGAATTALDALVADPATLADLPGRRTA